MGSGRSPQLLFRNFSQSTPALARPALQSRPQSHQTCTIELRLDSRCWTIECAPWSRLVNVQVSGSCQVVHYQSTDWDGKVPTTLAQSVFKQRRNPERQFISPFNPSLCYVNKAAVPHVKVLRLNSDSNPESVSFILILCNFHGLSTGAIEI